MDVLAGSSDNYDSFVIDLLDRLNGKKVICKEKQQQGLGKNDMELLRELRNHIQQYPGSVKEFARLGAISILLNKLKHTANDNQVFILQILASLGYLVQKSDERIEMAVDAGAFEIIINLLVKQSTSEGVLLLGIQVITFLVDESPQRLLKFYKSNGVNVCLKILKRGCVRSSLLNARVATLLAKIAENGQINQCIPICKKLLGLISNCVDIMGNFIEEVTPMSFVKKKNQVQLFKQVDDTCITLIQGLGLVFDSSLKYVDIQSFPGLPQLFLKLLGYHHLLSTQLIETCCWTLTYTFAENLEQSLAFARLNGEEILCNLIQHSERLEDTFILAFSSALSQILNGLLSQDDDEENFGKEKAISICDNLRSKLNLLDTFSSQQPNGKMNVVENKNYLVSLHTVGNTLRTIRRITRLGEKSYGLFHEQNLFGIYIHLLSNIANYPGCIIAEILQEIGLLVENNPAIGLYLAKNGACEELIHIVETCKTSQELCNATRALACFVEHGGTVGNQITDIALSENCEACLIKVLCEENSERTDQEVLLNSVGALGYMVKRQSIISKKKKPSEIMLENHKNACVALVKLLGKPTIDESLTWNAIWALIYLMNSASETVCTRAVYDAGGIDFLTNIVTTYTENQPLVCSAAKALYHVINKTPGNPIKSLPLTVRMKIIACATRSRSATQNDNTSNEEDNTNANANNANNNNNNNNNGGGTIDIVIDPNNIADSSVCVLENLNGEDLRSNGLKIQYVSDRHGQQVGIDAGGIRRDWLSRLSAELFDPKFNLVIAGYNPNDSVQISPKPEFGGLSKEDQRKWYRLMGQILGLSILYGDPLGVALVPSFCKLLLEKQPDFDDIKYVSKQYYTTFSLLKQLRETNQEQFEEALGDLTFTVNSRECMMKEAFERDSPSSSSSSISSKNNDLGVVASSSSSSNSVVMGPPSVQSPLSKYIKENAGLEKIKTLKQVSIALREARQLQDRDLIRKLLKLQNKIIQSQQLKGDDQDSHDELNNNIKTRKRNLSASSTDSFGSMFGESPAKRFNSGKSGMKRMMSDLMDGGGMEQINPGNFDRYLELLTFKLLTENVSSQVAMIKDGLHEILPRDIIIDLVTPEELGQLIEGDRNISVDNWKNNTQYKGGSEEDTIQIKWFWEYVTSLKKEDRQRLLLWATGWRSIGQTGFAHRHFTIELTNVKNAAENERLPSVATCGFHLWLPKYSNKQQLVNKFKLAMRETTFGNC